MGEIDFGKVQNVHFIGIGGIGMSALARMMINEGKSVTGSEASFSRITEDLEQEGALVFEGHNAENIPRNTDLVIYTAAISSDNPELLEAHARLIPLLTYPQALGEIAKGYRTIAISGTHGKTTTTAMVAEIAIGAGLDPTVVVGSYLKKPRGTNFIPGSSDLLIVEACEYKRHFLNLEPDILVITNIEEDHLDYYKDLEDIQSAFRELALKTKEAIICNPNHPNVRLVIKNLENVKIFDYTEYGQGITVGVPGEHNKLNAQAALVASYCLEVDMDLSREILKSFDGTWRRFEYKGEIGNGAILYDDYAHHPTEIEATIQGFRVKYPDKKLAILFQPHLYSRTKLLLNDFVTALSKAEIVYLLPIYAARELFDESISSEMLADELERKGVFAKAIEAEEALLIMQNASSDDGWITMGAGDVYKIGESALKRK